MMAILFPIKLRYNDQLVSYQVSQLTLFLLVTKQTLQLTNPPAPAVKCTYMFIAHTRELPVCQRLLSYVVQQLQRSSGSFINIIFRLPTFNSSHQILDHRSALLPSRSYFLLQSRQAPTYHATEQIDLEKAWLGVLLLNDTGSSKRLQLGGGFVRELRSGLGISSFCSCFREARCFTAVKGRRSYCYAPTQIEPAILSERLPPIESKVVLCRRFAKTEANGLRPRKEKTSASSKEVRTIFIQGLSIY